MTHFGGDGIVRHLKGDIKMGGAWGRRGGDKKKSSSKLRKRVPPSLGFPPAGTAPLAPLWNSRQSWLQVIKLYVYDSKE